MTDLTFFLHITKTAGGSLKTLFHDALGDEVVFLNASQADQMPALEEKVRMVFGHFSYGMHEKFSADANYACILRNPLSRTISHYFHLYNIDKGPIGDKIRKGGADINEYFANNNHWEFSNFMTKILAGTSNLEDKRSESKIFRMALDNLNQFSYIGIFEQLDLSLLTIYDKFAIEVNKVPKINIGQYKLAEVSKETIKTILRINRLDFLIYEIGVERFWRQIHKL